MSTPYNVPADIQHNYTPCEPNITSDTVLPDTATVAILSGTATPKYSATDVDQTLEGMTHCSYTCSHKERTEDLIKALRVWDAAINLYSLAGNTVITSTTSFHSNVMHDGTRAPTTWDRLYKNSSTEVFPHEANHRNVACSNDTLHVNVGSDISLEVDPWSYSEACLQLHVAPDTSMEFNPMLPSLGNEFIIDTYHLGTWIHENKEYTCD